MINCFSEGIKFQLTDKKAVENWLNTIAQNEGYSLHSLNYIFCSDNYLLELNQKHLNHDTLTDIITFDLSESENEIEGEIYISIDRVKENSEKLNTRFTEELHRVMVHGLLHLIGYDDKSKKQKEAMRKKENEALALI